MQDATSLSPHIQKLIDKYTYLFIKVDNIIRDKPINETMAEIKISDKLITNELNVLIEFLNK